MNTMEQPTVTPVQTFEMNGITFTGFDARVYKQNGARHVYGIDENGKHHHLSADAIAEHFGYDPKDPNALPTPEVATAMPTPAEVAGVGAVAAAVEVAPTAVKPRKGFLGRIREAASNFGERFNTPTIHRKIAAVAGLLMVAGSFGAARSNDMHNDVRPSVAMSADQPTLDTMLIGESRIVLRDGEATTTTTTEAPKSAEQLAQEARDKAVDQKLVELGLQAGQYEAITDENAVLPGPIEAGRTSMNHGVHAWDGYARTLMGAKQMGADLLSGNASFNQSDASVAQAALASKNVPTEIIMKLAAGDYSDMTIKGFLVDSPVYHGMTFNNHGVLATEALRTGVGTKDGFVIISYKNTATGNYETVATRLDCGGVGPQSFDTITVPTPPATPVAPAAPETPKTHETPKETTTTTTPKTTTTTGKPTTTTTTIHTTTTVAAGPKQGAHNPVEGGSSTTVETPEPGPSVPTTSTTRPTTTIAPNTIPNPNSTTTVAPSTQPTRP